MKTFVLEREQIIARPRDELFPFFADARNLEAITPRFLQFQVITPGPIEMRAGALIDYRIRLRGVPIRWRTEISVWEPPFRFVDRQLRGPYRKWVHEHRFEEVAGGTRCLDRVEYAVPGGPLIEDVVHTLFVRRDVERIFDYRRETLDRLLGRSDARGVTPEGDHP